jgi:hypothetical protein
MVPAVALHVTAELKAPVPATVAEQVDVPLTATLLGVQVTETDVMVGAAVMATVAEDDTVAVCTEVAVIVALPDVGMVAGAV